MKYRSLILLLLFFFSCEKSDPLSLPTDGEYEGILVVTDQTIGNGIPSPVRRDTLFVQSLTLAGNTFRRPGPEWGGDICEGTVTFENEQVTFSSNDCDCLCACFGNFDCRDFIPGQYQYRLTNDSLILWREDSLTWFVESMDLTLDVFSRDEFFFKKQE